MNRLRGGFPGVQGQVHCEGRAGPQSALDGEASGVPVEHMLDQCEPQPGTSLRPAVGNVDTVKPLRKPGQMLGRNPWAVITYRHAHFRLSRTRLSLCQRDIHSLAGSTILK